jgi:hypothetical protein
MRNSLMKYVLCYISMAWNHDRAETVDADKEQNISDKGIAIKAHYLSIPGAR